MMLKRDNVWIDTNDTLWAHTMMRIENAEKTAKNFDDFSKKMIARLQKIKHIEKVYYAIEALNQKGYQDLVDVYNGRLVMEKLLNSNSMSVFNNNRGNY